MRVRRGSQLFGRSFTFVRLDEGDDPPVYSWQEGSDGLESVSRESATFSAFLLGMVQEYIQHQQNRYHEDQ
jgi:hypothetical protein